MIKTNLLNGLFKNAFDLNVNVLLKYDTDSLLAPYFIEAGMKPKKPAFDHWKGLDGHVAGHYLSALAMAWAKAGNLRCKERADYIIAELKPVQKKGKGYLGGIPNCEKLWGDLKNGVVKTVKEYWAPWYNIHKMYAGLRDVWLYCANDDAKQMFLNLCDWGCTVIDSLNDDQMEEMLATEFGGMNEVYADAYVISGNEKYLEAAKRFSHREIFDNMLKGIDNLDNKHANTQIPKAVGYARIAELTGSLEYRRAAEFFWETVVSNRTLSFGGNSRREHFTADKDAREQIEDREGPETCNTYNMLKLANILFRIDPQARYADFIERALYNHILSSQHPEHGGYVYFTSARPGHYRVYSQVNKAMWCCVGTGMENHLKYDEFIYTQIDNTLYVNLFAASSVEWKEKNMVVTQTTNFPDEDQTTLTLKVKEPVRCTLAIRCPFWVTNSAIKIVIDSKNYAENAGQGAEESSAEGSSYILIDRTWKDGDTVCIEVPMSFRIEKMPKVSDYIAIMRGPILLGAKTSGENLDGLMAEYGRWDQGANGALMPLYEAPCLLGETDEIAAKLSFMQPVKDKPFSYTCSELFSREQDKSKQFVFEPFFRIHDSRYIIYWLAMTEVKYKNFIEKLLEAEKEKIALDNRTIDAVNPGEQQPETDHQLQQLNSRNGLHYGEAWRDAVNGGFFQYRLKTGGNENVRLMLRYWGNWDGERAFDILIDDQLLANEDIAKFAKGDFINVEYPVPNEMVKGKDFIRVKFQCIGDNIAGGVFNVRLLKN
ncbi:MAG: glycoside hydrolase family 127 protein [Treponema sp.]|nr:glycoside hydrolase family 127 protein [Treponema sp.]